MPVVPFIGPAIGIAGSLFGRKSNAINGTTAAQQQGANILNQQAQRQGLAADRGNDFALEQAQQARNWLGASQDVFGKGETFLNQASNALNPAADYYGNILSGNRASMMDAAAPEIQNINANYNQAQRQAGMFAPMGGGRANLLAQLPLQRAGAVGTLFQTIRPQAAQGLINVGNARGALAGITGNMASSMGNIGAGLSTSTLANLLNFGQGGTATGSALANFGLGQSQLQNQAGSQFGGGLASLASAVPWGSIFRPRTPIYNDSPEEHNWGY